MKPPLHAVVVVCVALPAVSVVVAFAELIFLMIFFSPLLISFSPFFLLPSSSSHLDSSLLSFFSAENLVALSQYCSEFLVHGVDVEGLKAGIEEPLVVLLGEGCPLPVTYGQ